MFSIEIDSALSLRLRGPEDAEAFFRLTDANRAHLREWLPWIDGTRTAADTAAHIDGCREGFRTGTSLALGLRLNDQWIGAAGFVNFDTENRAGEIGYWIAEPFQGRGLMTRAVRALIGHGFATRRLHRVEIRCARGNGRSAAVARRLGFREEGLLREAQWLHDRFEDCRVFGLLAGEW